jgi:hypothetical protein
MQFIPGNLEKMDNSICRTLLSPYNRCVTRDDRPRT